MNSGKCRTKYGNAIWEMTRPTFVGLLLSCVVTAGLIAAFSLVFVFLESIADSAVVPLALISAALGCFAGAFLCACMVRHRGIIFGAAIGLMMFLIICVIGLMGSDGLFGTETVIKLLLLLLAGCAGGYLGGGYGRKRRK